MRHARADYERFQDPAGLIPEEEPVFLIRGQDKIGAMTVRAWARFAQATGASIEIVDAAYRQAERMEDWAKKKIPDLPRAEPETPDEVIARLTKERDAWKKRAAQHGCNVEDGDEDCG